MCAVHLRIYICIFVVEASQMTLPLNIPQGKKL